MPKLTEDVSANANTKEALRRDAGQEKTVQGQTAQLEAINKEFDAFVYAISHDLRAPLRSIRGFSEVVLDRYSDKLDATGRDFLKRVCASAVKINEQIEDLLQFSRLTRTELRVKEVSLSDLALAIGRELARENPDRQVHLKVEPDLKATGDEQLLRVVLEVLLENAWKFTGKTPSPAVEFGKARVGEGAFYVRDNGTGFDMRNADRLFAVFQRLHLASEFPGNGIGLAIARRIINKHGGRVWAEGELEKGATFYFWLPEATGT